MEKQEIMQLKQLLGRFCQSGTGVIDRSVCEKAIGNFAQNRGEEKFCRLAASLLVALAKPENALPGSLKRYELLVRDGVTMFLSLLSVPRLQKALLDQALLKTDCPVAERCVNLAMHFPTLHKLGQIVARHHPGHSLLHGWLASLEDSGSKASIGAVRNHVQREWDRLGHSGHLELGTTILAEASVAAVLPFCWHQKAKNKQVDGVFKVLKPAVREMVEEELQVIGRMAKHLESNKARYGLGLMRVSGLCSELREALEKETDLVAEQKNLSEAAKLYRSLDRVSVPELTAFRSSAMTGMQRIRGRKITEVRLSPGERLHLACRLFTALVCVPLFSHEESSLFHGDPHAGNLLVVEDDKVGPIVVVIDWTLVGRLGRPLRINIAAMMLAAATGEVADLSRSISAMTRLAKSPVSPGEIKHIVASFFRSEKFCADPLQKSFRLLERLTFEGILFPGDLILFRKALFTLEGVLIDFCPSFSMEQAMKTYLGEVLIEEMPRRITNMFVPLLEKRSEYRSLLTNEEVARLSLSSSLGYQDELAAYGRWLQKTQMQFVASILPFF
ncbi:AarF/UbiB family protein [Desulforhopalus singaporensis]|uniref:Ubiquinone biosynthesis protein n=1 Tax=Desulforhopalus singaporensis TaxID=91360 RepID=A0A1H0J3A2_9BACT|nr:AarF/UbiB family protein [Desulforhopalus singaporensis]SDO37821.1 ubiquinone biosynthesis protein [Desulforhopalus singaporensis]